MTPRSAVDQLNDGWYPVARSRDLDTPCPAVLLGRRLVAFRGDDGSARVLPDRCLHRGGSLHRGAVIGDAIECPYHGWRWRGSDGSCVGVPAESAAANRTVGALAALPAVDRYGLIWTCLGEPAAGPPELAGCGHGLSFTAAEPVDVIGTARPAITTTRANGGTLIWACSPVREGAWRVFPVTVAEPER